MIMKIAVKVLRHIIREVGEKIGASADYMLKERIREQLQELIVDNVASGKIVDQAGLDRFIKDVGTATLALKGIPFDVYAKLARQTVQTKKPKKQAP